MHDPVRLWRDLQSAAHKVFMSELKPTSTVIITVRLGVSEYRAWERTQTARNCYSTALLVCLAATLTRAFVCGIDRGFHPVKSEY